MRITNNTLTGNYLRNLNKNLERMHKSQNQLSSLKEVSKPSDDPMLVSKIMNLRQNIQANEQYKKNINDGIGWTDTADGALDTVSATLLRARELIQYGANGSLSDTDRIAIKNQVDTLQDELTQVLNSNYGGRYIFGGQRTTEPPFLMENGVMTYRKDGVPPTENHEKIYREIAQNVNVAIEADGSKITRIEKSPGVFQDLGDLLKSVSDALESGNSASLDSLSGEYLADMDLHIDNAIRFRTRMGANANRLESAKQRNESENLGMKTNLSTSEDIDLAEKMMEYSMMSTSYQASLSVGAKILQSSLLDYIR